MKTPASGAKLTSVFIFSIGLLFSTTIFSQSPITVAGVSTHVATQSGLWSDASTWGGSVPTTDSRVEIPSGVVVSVGSKVSYAYKSIYINGGSLKFLPDVDTELKTEYMVSSMSGSLEIGTSSTPISDNVTANLVVSDRGGTSVSEDPERFAPGIVLMGPVSMYGKEKSSWVTLSAQALAGSNSLSLSTVPTGWEVGDQIIVAPTDINNQISEDLVSISSLSGTSVGLSSSLVYDHKAPTEASDLNVHVANISRNIKISSENTSVSAKRRGHLMFMHNLNVNMYYVELNNMGRTDKSVILDDYTWDDLQQEASYVPPRGAYTNPRGRYSLHFHRGGFDPSLTAAHVEGVSVNTDPGWGFVNHSSRVDFVKNVSYNVLGGAYITEAGDETGSFVDNIAIRSYNPSDPLSDPRLEEALVDIREDAQDFSWQGDAYWFHSTGITVSGNIAAGVSGHAFIFWPEGLIENGQGMRRGSISSHVTDPSQSSLLSGVSNSFVLECWMIPSKPFTNNVAYTVSKGIMGYYVQTRFLDSPALDNIAPESYRQSLDAVFDGTTIWNIRNKGIEFIYTSDVTIQNSRIVGYGSPSTAIGMDLNHFHNLDDWNIRNNVIEGFDNNNIGLLVPLNANINIDGGTFDNTSTDIEINETNFLFGADDNPENDRGKQTRTLNISNVVFNESSNNIVMNPKFALAQEAQDGVDFDDEPKNTLYFLFNDEITLNFGPFNNAKLYFDQQAADFVPITKENRKIESEKIPSKYVGKTNCELFSKTTNPSTCFGGSILHAKAVSHPSIVGGKTLENALNQGQEVVGQFKIYPNPTPDFINIEGNLEGSDLKLYNWNGRLLEDMIIDRNVFQLDLTSKSYGVYFLNLVDQNGCTSQNKVLKIN